MRAPPGIEPGTSCTRSKNHTTRPRSRHGILRSRELFVTRTHGHRPACAATPPALCRRSAASGWAGLPARGAPAVLVRAASGGSGDVPTDPRPRHRSRTAVQSHVARHCSSCCCCVNGGAESSCSDSFAGRAPWDLSPWDLFVVDLMRKKQAFTERDIFMQMVAQFTPRPMKLRLLLQCGRPRQ